jgi:hypothetical protein
MADLKELALSSTNDNDKIGQVVPMTITGFLELSSDEIDNLGANRNFLFFFNFKDKDDIFDDLLQVRRQDLEFKSTGQPGESATRMFFSFTETFEWSFLRDKEDLAEDWIEIYCVVQASSSSVGNINAKRQTNRKDIRIGF